MEINSKEFIQIMGKNFGYNIIVTKLGRGVVVDPFTAFIYSTVTGAGYLDDPLYQFTPKGLMKLFYNALDYKFVTGIFDNTTLKNTPYLISQAKYSINGSIPFPFLDFSMRCMIKLVDGSFISVKNLLSFF